MANSSAARESPLVVDLFAGAGGLSEGFKAAGGRIAVAVEEDHWAAETLARNHPDLKVIEQDIRTVNAERVAEEAGAPVDIVIGGPPCQGFSHSNVTRLDPNDSRNSLFNEYLRMVDALEPKVCVIENVPGLLRARNPQGALVIQEILEAFDDLGYEAEYRLLNSVNYGVPQYRERLFIVAVRTGTCTELRWPHPVNRTTPSNQEPLSLFTDGLTLADPITLWDALSDLPQIYSNQSAPLIDYSYAPQNVFQEQMRLESTGIYNHEPMRHTARITERFMAISVGECESDVSEELRPRKRGDYSVVSGKAYGQNSRRQNPDEPCNTIVASSHTNFIHPFLHRNFTVRELARVQSFPDRYRFYGKRAVLSRKLSIRKGYVDDIYLDQRAQVGNAVPPKLAQHLADAVYGGLQSTLALSREP